MLLFRKVVYLGEDIDIHLTQVSKSINPACRAKTFGGMFKNCFFFRNLDLNKNIIRYQREQKTRTKVVHKNVIQDVIISEIIKIKSHATSP